MPRVFWFLIPQGSVKSACFNFPLIHAWYDEKDLDELFLGNCISHWEAISSKYVEQPLAYQIVLAYSTIWPHIEVGNKKVFKKDQSSIMPSSCKLLIANMSDEISSYRMTGPSGDTLQGSFYWGFFLKVWCPRRLYIFATSILRIYRNNNAQYNIINSVLPVAFPIHTCSIVLRKVSSNTFIGQRSSGSISSSVASGKIPVHK